MLTICLSLRIVSVMKTRSLPSHLANSFKLSPEDQALKARIDSMSDSEKLAYYADLQSKRAPKAVKREVKGRAESPDYRRRFQTHLTGLQENFGDGRFNLI